MKRIALAMFLLVLTGCSVELPTSDIVNPAVKLCEANGGYVNGHYIKEYSRLHISVNCADGSRKSIVIVREDVN